MLRIALGLVVAYVALVILAWLFQERLAFPAPRAPVPDPRRLGVTNGERIELVMGDGTKLAGGDLAPRPVRAPQAAAPHPSPPLLWVFGNRRNTRSQWAN